jgi:hypothetical protein
MKEFHRMQKLAGLLVEDRTLRFVTPWSGGGSGHGQEYAGLQVYEKNNDVVFKLGDPGFDGVPSTVYVMRNKNIYHAMQVLSDMGYPVLDDTVELQDDSEDSEEEVYTIIDNLSKSGEVFRFDPEVDIETKQDVDKYNGYLLDDEQYSYEDFGV